LRVQVKTTTDEAALMRAVDVAMGALG